MLQICARLRGRLLVRFVLTRYDAHPFRPRDLEKILDVLPTLEVSLAAGLSPTPKVEPPDLTPREWEVAHLATKGLTTPEIAAVLKTSRHTVRNQLARIYQKLEVGSRAELAAFVTAVEASPALVQR